MNVFWEMSHVVSAEDLKKGFEIADWADDPSKASGRARMESALKAFGELLQHPWLKELVRKEEARVLDLCAGRGIGGVALAKILRNAGVKVSVTFVDKRDDALEDALRLAKSEKIPANARAADALKAHELGKFDAVLIYGASLIHFNEWEHVRLFASAAASLEPNGLLIVEEMDRVHAIFRSGFKDFIVENKDPASLSVSVYVRYDPLTASHYRTFVRLRDGKSVTLPFTFRSIAHIASVAWLFFEDVDLVLLSAEKHLYAILGLSLIHI